MNGSCPARTYHSSPPIRAISCRVASSVTTTYTTPWLNPALGACCPASTMRSMTSSDTGSSVKFRIIRRFRSTSWNCMAYPPLARSVAAAKTLHSGEETDQVAVRILDDRVALAPERVPRRLVAAIPGVGQPRVGGIDVVGAVAPERQLDSVAAGFLPAIVDAGEHLDGIPREAYPAEVQIDVRLVLDPFRDREPQQSIEAERRRHVLHGDPDLVQFDGHCLCPSFTSLR